jgi:hypothetical protein
MSPEGVAEIKDALERVQRIIFGPKREEVAAKISIIRNCIISALQHIGLLLGR